MTEATEAQPGQLYVRRGAKVAGPFPRMQVKRHVVLGRVHATDELSSDRKNWRKVAEVRGFREALKPGSETLRREDERAHGDRRDREGEVSKEVRERRQGVERRRLEKADIKRHREMKSRLLQDLRQRPHSYGMRPWLISAFIAGILGLGFLLVPRGGEVSLTANCSAEPGPNLNWNNCRLDGLQAVAQDLHGLQARSAHLRSAALEGADLKHSDLSYADLSLADLSNAHLDGAQMKGTSLLRADLSYARLRGADLSYADLSQANLGGASLDDAIFDHAVWMDGKVCQPGSLGTCKR